MTAQDRQDAYRAAVERKARRNTHAARASVVEARIALEAKGERVPDYGMPIYSAVTDAH